MASYVLITDPRLEEIRQEKNQQDEALQVLMNVILQGWPDVTANPGSPMLQPEESADGSERSQLQRRCGHTN